MPRTRLALLPVGLLAGLAFALSSGPRPLPVHPHHLRGCASCQGNLDLGYGSALADATRILTGHIERPEDGPPRLIPETAHFGAPLKGPRELDLPEQPSPEVALDEGQVFVFGGAPESLLLALPSAAPERLAAALASSREGDLPALCQALPELEDTPRRRLLADLNGDEARIRKLDAESLTPLLALARSLPLKAPELATLLELFALRSDLDLARDAWLRTEVELRPIVARLLREAGDERHIDALTEALDGPQGAAAALLLARADDPRAAAALLPDLRHGEPEREGAALLACAGWSEAPEAARERAYEIVRAHLLGAPRPAPASALEDLLAQRDLRDARAAPFTGERLRLTAAGFLLARSSQAQDRGFLRARLARLDDPAAAARLQALLTDAFAGFDAPW